MATVLVGATRQSQLDDNLQAMEFELPAALLARLEAASAPPASFPYMFFTPGMQAMLAGSNPVGDKPATYAPRLLIQAAAAGVGGETAGGESNASGVLGAGGQNASWLA